MLLYIYIIYYCHKDRKRYCVTQWRYLLWCLSRRTSYSVVVPVNRSSNVVYSFHPMFPFPITFPIGLLDRVYIHLPVVERRRRPTVTDLRDSRRTKSISSSGGVRSNSCETRVLFSSRGDDRPSAARSRLVLRLKRVLRAHRRCRYPVHIVIAITYKDVQREPFSETIYAYGSIPLHA